MFSSTYFISHGISKVPGLEDQNEHIADDINSSEEASSNNALDGYSINLNRQASEGLIDPLIGREVEEALHITCQGKDIQIAEFTVAPQVNPETGLPFHEWFIQFAKEPKDIEAFALAIDIALQEKNSYYKDLIRGNILRSLVIRKVEENGFNNYMKNIGKLGGQNKVARLSNDRIIADKLKNYLID